MILDITRVFLLSNITAASKTLTTHCPNFSRHGKTSDAADYRLLACRQRWVRWKAEARDGSCQEVVKMHRVRFQLFYEYFNIRHNKAGQS